MTVPARTDICTTPKSLVRRQGLSPPDGVFYSRFITIHLPLPRSPWIHAAWRMGLGRRSRAVEDAHVF